MAEAVTMDPKDLHVRLIAGAGVLGQKRQTKSERHHPTPQEYEQHIEALAEFVTRARCGQSFEHLAREYGRSIATVHSWVTQTLCNDVAEVGDQEPDELERLREQNAKLEAECERWTQALADDVERCSRLQEECERWADALAETIDRSRRPCTGRVEVDD